MISGRSFYECISNCHCLIINWLHHVFFQYVCFISGMHPAILNRKISSVKIWRIVWKLAYVCFLTYLFSAIPNYCHSQDRKRKEISLWRVNTGLWDRRYAFTHLFLIPVLAISQIWNKKCAMKVETKKLLETDCQDMSKVYSNLQGFFKSFFSPKTYFKWPLQKMQKSDK